MRMDRETHERMSAYERGPDGPQTTLRVVGGHENIMRLAWGYFALGNPLGNVVDFMCAGQRLWSPSIYSATKTTWWVLKIYDAINGMPPDHSWEDFLAVAAKKIGPEAWTECYTPRRWRDPASALAFRMPDKCAPEAP